jgi:glutaminyl-tRNA synthetase
LYSSDYFQQLYDWAIGMIKNGKAYVDSQSSQRYGCAKGTPTQAGITVPTETVLRRNISLFEGMKTAIFQKEVMFYVQK